MLGRRRRMVEHGVLTRDTTVYTCMCVQSAYTPCFCLADRRRPLASDTAPSPWIILTRSIKFRVFVIGTKVVYYGFSFLFEMWQIPTSTIITTNPNNSIKNLLSFINTQLSIVLLPDLPYSSSRPSLMSLPDFTNLGAYVSPYFDFWMPGPKMWSSLECVYVV